MILDNKTKGIEKCDIIGEHKIVITNLYFVFIFLFLNQSNNIDIHFRIVNSSNHSFVSLPPREHPIK